MLSRFTDLYQRQILNRSPCCLHQIITIFSYLRKNVRKFDNGTLWIFHWYHSSSKKCYHDILSIRPHKPSLSFPVNPSLLFAKVRKISHFHTFHSIFVDFIWHLSHEMFCMRCKFLSIDFWVYISSSWLIISGTVLL